MVFTRLLSNLDVYHNGSWNVRFTVARISKSQSYWIRINTDVFDIDCDDY